MTVKKIIITGVNKGFGLALAQKFLSEGWLVIGSSRIQSTELKTLKEQYNSRLNIYFMDLEDQESIEKFVDQIEVDKIDALVNNAATSMGVTPIYEFIEDTNRIFQINIISHMLLVSLLFRKGVLKRGSSIINVTSVAASKPFNFLGLYCITKAAFESYTKSLAFELKTFGIRVNSVGISAQTDLYLEHASQKAEFGYTSTLDRIHKGERLPDPISCVDVTYFLASELSLHVTGQHIESNSMDVWL